MFLVLQVVLPITRPTTWPSLKPKSLLCDVWISSLIFKEDLEELCSWRSVTENMVFSLIKVFF